MSMKDFGNYKVIIEGEWTLEDLYLFPRTYEQVYYLLYSLSADRYQDDFERLVYAYTAFPWQGGYSAVNFYNQLKYAVAAKDRPRIVSIQYSSPGWIELSLVLAIAVSLNQIVRNVASSIREANSVYNSIYKGLQKRKILRIKVKREEIRLEREQLQYMKESIETMYTLLGIKDIGQLDKIVDSPYKMLKILLSLYRRIRTLAKYQNNGKIKF